MLKSFLKIARDGSVAVIALVTMTSAPMALAAPDNTSPATHAAVAGGPLIAAGATVAGLGTWSLVAGIAAHSAMVAAGVAPAVLAVSAGSALLIGASVAVVVVGVALLGYGAYRAYKAYEASKAKETSPGVPSHPGSTGTTTTGSNTPTNGGTSGTPVTPGHRGPPPISVVPGGRTPLITGSNVARNSATVPNLGAPVSGPQHGVGIRH